MPLRYRFVLQSIVIVLILILYVFLAGSNIRLPGIDGDSSGVGTMSYRLFKHREFFLMQHPREGMTDAYIIAPFFFFFSDPVTALRYGCIFINGIALLIFYFFARSFFKSYMLALLVMLLIATHPSFIYGSRCGIVSHLNVFLPVSIALWAFQQWQENNKLFLFFLAIFCLGVAVGARILGLWIVNCFLFYFLI